MVLPGLIAAAKAVGAFIASKTLAATAIKFVVAVGLMRAFRDLPSDPPRQRNKTNVRAAVSPARYIYGEALTGGVVAYAFSHNRDMWVVYAISRGACDSITGLYIDGKRQTLARTAAGVITITSGKYAGQVKLWEEFAADGSTTGAGAVNLRAVYNSDWTEHHKGVGVSYVIAKLTQTERDNEGVFSGFPELMFAVKGRKITWPGQSTPVWTENAAAVIYDYLRVRRGVPAAEIDNAAFQAAYAICNAQVPVSRPDSRYSDWDATEMRYAINGIVFADDDPDRVQTEFGFAIRGNVYEWNGKFRINAGANRTPTMTITDADIIEVESVTVAPSLSDRINVATMGLDQSRYHEFQSYAAPEVVDQVQLDRDGERLEKNLGTRFLINSPAALDRLLVGNMRRARSSMSVTLRLLPGRLMKWLTLQPTTLCSITNRVHGLENWWGEVSAVSLNEDFSITAVFDEIAAGEFDDDLGLGALPGRKVSVPRVDDQPAQIAESDITAVAIPRAGGGGTILWKVTVSVPASFLGFLASLEMGDITLTDFTTGNSLEFDIDAYRANMEIKVWRASKRGLAGPTTTKTITPQYTTLTIPRPGLSKTWTQTGNDLLVSLLDPNTPIVKGAEFRYTYEPLVNADGTPNTAIPGSITAAAWSAANILDAQTLLFKPNSNALFNLKFFTSGKYRIHARFVDAVGRYGPVGDLGYLTMVVPENPSHIIGGAPSWPGTLNHMHRFVFDDATPLLSIPAGAPNTLTADQWDGARGASFWPFGPVEGEDAAFDAASSTYYETSVLDLGQNKSGYFDADFEVFTPSEDPAESAGASADAGPDAPADEAFAYLPAFTGPAMPNQAWEIGQPIEQVYTPAADVEHGFLTYSAEGLPEGVHFGGGRLSGIPTGGPTLKATGGDDISGVARLTATAENGATDHCYFAWHVMNGLAVSPAAGSTSDPHVLQNQGVAKIRHLLRDGAMNPDDPDPAIPTWFEVSIPANTVLEFRVVCLGGEDFDLMHNGRVYASGGPLEAVRIENKTSRRVSEKVAVYRYAAETDPALINTDSEGGVSHSPVHISLAPPLPSGEALANEWMAGQDGAGGLAVTGEFVAEMAVFSAPSVNPGETPTYTEAAITAGNRVAVSSVRFLKGRIHVKKARNRALKSVAFTFIES